MKKQPRLPVLTALLLAGVFVFGSLAGAFVYATGKAVKDTPTLYMVSHTEYRFGEPGQVIARLVDFQGNPVAVTSCKATILNPDKTFFVSNQTMSDSVNIAGDHFYNFTTPYGPEGTYEYQATCTYGAGKVASVTNSFHLSSAFTSVLGNVTGLKEQMGNVTANVTALSAQLNTMSLQLTDVNASLSADIAGLSSQLTTDTANTLEAIRSVNSTMDTKVQEIQTHLSAVNASLAGQFAGITTQLDANAAKIDQIIGNMSVLQAQMTAMSGQIDTAELNIESMVMDSKTSILASIQGNTTYLDDKLTQMSMDATQNKYDIMNNVTDGLSAISTKIDAINVTGTDYSGALSEINSTTQGTYTYLTTTVAANLDQVLIDLGIIKDTTARIEANTVQINSTVNDIKKNQEEQVTMTVFSG